MTDAFILGAGFSRAVSERMPLTSDLPAELAKFEGLPDDFAALLRRFGGNVEHAMTYLAQSQPYLREPDNLRNRAAFLDVSQNLGLALAFCQQEAVTTTGTCPQWLWS